MIYHTLFETLNKSPILFIPPSYRDILAGEYTNGQIMNLFMGKYTGKGDKAQELIDKFATASYLKDIARSLLKEELKALRRVIRKGGYISEKDKGFPASHIIDNLQRKGLVVKSRIDNGEVVIAPLEVCLGIPFDRDETAHSLLMAMNRYSSDLIKLMASRLSIPNFGKYHKTMLASIIYREIIKGYSLKVNLLDDRERFLLKTIFMHRGIIEHVELKNIATSKGFSVAQLKSWYSGDNLLQYLTNPFYRRSPESVNGDFEKTIINLILFGIIAVSYRETYDSYWFYVIPTEVMPFIADDFFKEMDEKRAIAEKGMYAEDPDVSISYAGRIVEDIIKVQIACVCGLIETQKQKSEFKKRSIANVANLLNTSEEYVKNLLETFQFYYRAFSQKIDYKTFQMLKTAALNTNYKKSLLTVLRPINRWVYRDKLIQYLINHRGFYQFATEHTESTIVAILKEFTLLGILDTSDDGKRLKPSVLLSEISKDLDFHKTIPLIKADEKPIIVQPNLDVIVPFNVEINAIKKLSEFADLTVLDRMLHFSITQKSLIRAVEHEWDKRRILYFLSTYSSRPVPDVVNQFLEDTIGRAGEVEVTPVSMLIRCKDIGVKGQLLSLKSLELLPVEGTEDYLYIIDADPQTAVKFFRKNGIFAEIKDNKPK